MAMPSDDAGSARRVSALVGVLLAAGMSLSGCSDDDPVQGPPGKVLPAARDALVTTSGVSLSLTTEELPSEVDGVLEATGVATRAPAFEGELTVSLNGLDVDVPVISVDGTVYAQLPFTASFAEVNPADYGAPDPAQLMASGTGIAAWLTEATEVESGDQVRQGDTVLSTYTGTLSGQVVDASIPSADADADFPVVFRIDDAGRLRSVVISGPFYGDKGEVEYTVALDDYGTTKDIEAP
ncbi:LppX_LprAFG lipoprotein [Nocardioides sp.]|uniref:LppX_LprAFG lipoprotein n=1 Tax=Nocardioides sp. TaxID=35761 RepID=UPI001A1D95B4|nr:LppX_LprAFG lipoprotein [Nocardioides sp.]MBJ7358673.1 LppX_LprAFG lipoprotein [Nocardioides sp.]